MLVIASDGVWDKVSAEEVAADVVVGRPRLSTQSKADWLRDVSLKRGSSDNISVVMCDL